MHPHTLDWLRNVEITVDSALAQKRWSVAEKYASTLSRYRIIKLLRLFLFPKPDATLTTEFTNELLKLDAEFPVSGNSESLRVMAGLVMATTFQGSSKVADAFALGLRAAQFNRTRGHPVVAGITVEAEKYLLADAVAQRPDDFDTQDGYIAKLTKKFDALKEAEASEDASNIQKARLAYHSAIVNQTLVDRVRQLAEESQLLWLIVGEYSPSLNRPTADLSAADYALVVAAECSARIKILPVPPSVEALLLRALTPCKSSRKKVTLVELLDATDAEWRSRQVSTTKNTDCRVLVPLCTALEKMHELSDALNAAQTIPALCSGVKSDMSFLPGDAAKQYFSELIFLAALGNC